MEIPTTMLAIIKKSLGPGLQLAKVPTPKPNLFEVLIKVSAVGICGSDLPIREWDDPWVREIVKPGQIIGHEFCGKVVSCGEAVTNVLIGNLVTAEGHINCEKCNTCRIGRPHLCPNQKLIGFDYPGAFAEYIVVPEKNVVKLNNLPIELAAILDPFGNAVQATTVTSLLNASVLITGCGSLGLMTIALAKYSGARYIYATDVSEYRLALARQLGADIALNPLKENINAVIKKLTHEDGGVDLYFEMSGEADAIIQGFKLLRPGGQCIMMGTPKKPVPFEFTSDLITKGITVHGLVGRKMFDTWIHSCRLLSSDSNFRNFVPIGQVITHRLLLNDFEQAFDMVLTRQCGKVLLFPDIETLKQNNL